METAVNPEHGSVIREQAAEWFLARRQGLDPGRMREFARWLATSPAHLAEYHAMERLGRDLPLAMGSAPAADELVEALRTPGRDEDTVIPIAAGRRARAGVLRHNPPWAMAAAFAFVAVGMLILWPKLQDQVAPRARTLTVASGRGELGKQLQLDAHTVLRLDTLSAVDYSNYEEANRLVEQLYGRVDYSIRHDPERAPFMVDARDVRLKDVGTRFSVYLMPDVTRITVLDGEVEVSVKGFSGTGRVVAGEQLDVVPGAPLGNPVKVDAGQAMSWTTRGSIRFEGESVADAAAEVSRYSPRRIEIQSGTLAKQPIHYTFATRDVEGFLEFLGSQLGAQRRDEPDRIVLTRP